MAGLGWRGQQGIRPCTEEGTGGSLAGLGRKRPARGRLHWGWLLYKLEVLDGLVVLDAGFQFHHLVLKLNMAPYSWPRTQRVCNPGRQPHPSHSGQEAPPNRGSRPWVEAGSITLPSDKAGLSSSQGRFLPCDRGRAPASGAHAGAPTGTLRGRGVQSQQQDTGWFHEPWLPPARQCPGSEPPGWGRSGVGPCPCQVCQALGTVASLPWISAILRLLPLSEQLHGGQQGSQLLPHSLDRQLSLWAQRRGCWALGGLAGACRAVEE